MYPKHAISEIYREQFRLEHVSQRHGSITMARQSGALRHTAGAFTKSGPSAHPDALFVISTTTSNLHQP